jgi:hypothetical protein
MMSIVYSQGYPAHPIVDRVYIQEQNVPLSRIGFGIPRLTFVIDLVVLLSDLSVMFGIVHLYPNHCGHTFLVAYSHHGLPADKSKLSGNSSFWPWNFRVCLHIVHQSPQ